ncbi:MAG: Gfo/Idh/MocA family oxidoreductase [Litorilinea sp.]
MGKRVRVAFLGLGQRGLQHVRNVLQLQQAGAAEIVAMGDAFDANIAPAKLQEYVPGIDTNDILLTTDFNQVLESKPDALYICIPPNVHTGQVNQAAEAGVHLFVEKPVSLFLDEAVEMDRVIAKSGIISTVGFNQRYDAGHEAVHSFLQDKRPVMAEYTRHDALEGHSVKHMQTEAVGGPVNRVWTASRAWSGGTLVEAGIHLLDLWRYWFGEVEWVQASYVHRPPAEIIDGADNPYAYVATFAFANGVLGSMNMSRLRRVFRGFGNHLVLWNEGQLEVEQNAVTAYHYDGPYPPAQKPAVDSLRTQLPQPEVVPGGGTFTISQAFVQAVAEENPELIRSPFDEAMGSLVAVIAGNVSDELDGKRVYVKDLLNSPEYAKFRAKPAKTTA